MYSVTGGGRETAAACRRAALGSISRIQTAQNHACVLPGALRVSDLGNVNIDHNAYIGGFKSG